jgi:hypothetical protein
VLGVELVGTVVEDVLGDGSVFHMRLQWLEPYRTKSLHWVSEGAWSKACAGAQTVSCMAVYGSKPWSLRLNRDYHVIPDPNRERMRVVSLLKLIPLYVPVNVYFESRRTI